MRKLEKAPRFDPAILGKYLSLADDPAVQQLLVGIHEQYIYWDKVKHKGAGEITAREIWMLAKLKRKEAANYLSFGDYRFYWSVNNTLQELLHFLDMNIGAVSESRALVSHEEKGRYLVSSLMEEAIASSQIEGAVTTRKKAKEMLRKNIRPTNSSEQMILNNYLTIQRILELKSEPLHQQNLLEIHGLITQNTLATDTEEGAFRTDNEIDVIDSATGEVVHHPPEISELGDMLTDLYRFFNDENGDLFIHPLIKASIIHFMVGFIHPFADGNGRTARALFYWYLLKKGYWLTEYLSISRSILRARAQYARAFQYTEIDEHDLTYFVLFNLRTLKLSYDDLITYVQRKKNEQTKLAELLKIESVSYKQAVILEWFWKEPDLLLTSKETENRLAISTVAARKNLMHLVEKKFLSIIHLDGKTNAFVRSQWFEEMAGV